MCHYCLAEMVACYVGGNREYFQEMYNSAPKPKASECSCTMPLPTAAGHCKCQCLCPGTTQYNSKREPIAQKESPA